MVAYAPRHGEQEIPHGSVRRRMALHRRPHLPEPTGQGRPRLHGLRAILDAVFYVLKSGCPWRLLPRDFPPWKTVYDWFRKWRIDGTFERLNAELRERLRIRSGRNPRPSAGIANSQSTNTTGVGGEQRGYDGGKKVRGRKRHLLVDTEGLVLKAKVHSAKVPDQDGIRLLLKGVGDRLPRLSHLWVDAGYQGQGKEWAQNALGLSVEVVHRTPRNLRQRRSRDDVGREEWSKEGSGRSIGKSYFHPGALRSCPEALGCGTHLLVALSEPQDEQGLRAIVCQR